MPAGQCRLRGDKHAFGEDEPHLVEGLLPGAWPILGRFNGIHIEASAGPGNDPPAVRVESPRRPVSEDAWER
jgi:hypothetical protein